MLPHDRAEYQQQMGHVWLGFPEQQMRKLLTRRGLRQHSRLRRCRSIDEAKGPALFAAVAVREREREVESSSTFDVRLDRSRVIVTVRSALNVSHQV